MAPMIGYYGIGLYVERSLHRRAPWLSAKDLLWFLYLYPFRFIATVASPASLHRLCAFLEPLIQFRSRKRRLLARNAMIVAGIPPAKAEIVSRKFVLNAAVRVMDDLVLGRGWRPRLALLEAQRVRRAPPIEPEIGPRRAPFCASSLEGIEHLQQAQAARRGVLILTGHFYASRVAKRYLEIAGYSILTVRNSKPRDELMGTIGKRFLQSRYIEFLHRVIQNEVFIQDPGCTLKIFQHLRSGGLVNIHFDAFRGHRTVERPFLGAPRLFSKGLLDIVRLSRCEVVPMSCTGTSINLRIAFNPAIEITPAAAGDAFVNANLDALVSAVEAQVLACPEEWELWTRL
jgi:hypothetical protein